MNPQAQSLSQAVTGNFTPVTSVTPVPEVTQALAPGFRGDVAAGKLQFGSYQDSVTESNRKEAIRAQAQALQDQTDPNKYTKVRKEDGGFDFYDPQGKQVDIATYALKTGKRAVDIISDSENPIDTQYINDYKNLQDYMDAIYNKDEEKLKQYSADLAQYQDQGGVDRLMQDFKKYYNRYYTPRSVDPNAWGTRPEQKLMVQPNPTQGGGLDLAALIAANQGG